MRGWELRVNLPCDCKEGLGGIWCVVEEFFFYCQRQFLILIPRCFAVIILCIDMIIKMFLIDYFVCRQYLLNLYPAHMMIRVK